MASKLSTDREVMFSRFFAALFPQTALCLGEGQGEGKKPAQKVQHGRKETTDTLLTSAEGILESRSKVPKNTPGQGSKTLSQQHGVAEQSVPEPSKKPLYNLGGTEISYLPEEVASAVLIGLFFKEGNFTSEDSFLEGWTTYLSECKKQNISDFPDDYRHESYRHESLDLREKDFVSGVEILIHAYDAILVAGDSRSTLETLCKCDTLKAITGAWFGAINGFQDPDKLWKVPENKKKWMDVFCKWFEERNELLQPISIISSNLVTERPCRRTEEHFVASMVLSGVGDAMGFKNGQWEFCKSGFTIKKKLWQLGGVSRLTIQPPDWLVSDDTLMHLATAEGIIEGWTKDKKQKNRDLYKNIAFKYMDCIGSMTQNREPGQTCMVYIAALEPTRSGGLLHQFNPRGGGCGAAMRAMCIGLRYARPEQLQNLVEVSIESGRLSHYHPTGYLGALAAALFTSYALQDKPLREWGRALMDTLEKAQAYVLNEERYVSETLEAWPFFESKWKKYLEYRNIYSGKSDPIFPKMYGVAEQDEFYSKLSYDGWGGSSGHDAPMIAYDALLGAQGDWEQVCERGMLHGGDSDSTGVMAGAWYGAMFGFKGVPKCNYQNLEFKDRLQKAGRKLYEIFMHEAQLSATTSCSAGLPCPTNEAICQI